MCAASASALVAQWGLSIVFTAVLTAAALSMLVVVMSDSRSLNAKSIKLISFIQTQEGQYRDVKRSQQAVEQALDRLTSDTKNILFNVATLSDRSNSLNRNFDQFERRADTSAIAFSDRLGSLQSRFEELRGDSSRHTTDVNEIWRKYFEAFDQSLREITAADGPLERILMGVRRLTNLSRAEHLEINDKIKALEIGSAEIERIVDTSIKTSMVQVRNRMARHVTDTVLEGTKQTEILLQLLPRLKDVEKLLPSTGGYAMDAQALLHLVNLLEARKPKFILELGGGTSTIWMGHICRQFGTKIISVDHLEDYLDATRAAVIRHGLEDIVDCRHAPLEKIVVDGREYDWYSKTGFSGIDGIDFLLIDGPPESTGPEARYPAVPVLSELLAPEALIVLDDTHRGTEKNILISWKENANNLRIVDSGVSRLGVLEKF
ncbi:putative O-methyltransferase YrrM [Paeniglutamicibacter psychrophenolicus]|uniref:O-methyltransferase YrrM n=1 Tax=Paeniglutamicibacter psychrophenolicus TaxID=257454 RepID=A0ABS4WDX3_9MICC|nr:putative O-methyltransferase YrrM [Paeniglutamicibacter psychrophenolicus]